MKRIIYILAIVGLLFTGCNPLDDINKAADAQDNPVVGSADYTLTADDYSALELGYGSFNSEDEAKQLIPGFLADTYPYSFWGQGSSVLVGYKLYIGNAFDLRDYNLDQEDYTFSGSDGLGFKADATPTDYLPEILATNVSNPKEGDYRLAKYYQYTGDFIIVTPTVSLDDNFDYGITAGDLTSITSNWTGHSGGTPFVGYATSGLSMTDYPSSDIGGSITISGSGSEDVKSEFTRITSGKAYYSALVNFSAVSTGTYFLHFMDDDNVNFNNFRGRVGAKDDGSGNILFGIGASSSTLTYGTTAFDLNTTYLVVVSYDLETGISNLYALTTPEATEPLTPEVTNTGNTNISVLDIAIRQGFGGPTGTIDGIRVANTWSAIMSNETLPDEAVGDKTAGEMYYAYTGTEWTLPSDRFYAITDDDFASMNISSFGSDTPPENYLSTFLGIKYPYAQEGDNMDIGYHYESSSSGPQSRGNLYTFIDGVWTGHASTIVTTLQFGFDKGTWVPDNTIRYSLSSADYEYIGNTLASDSDYSGITTTLINYHDYDYNWSQEQIIYSLGVLLDHIDPSAEEGQKYQMSYLVYDSGIQELTAGLIKTGGVWVSQ